MLVNKTERIPFNHLPKNDKENSPVDKKTYSVARKIFEGIALIALNVLTLGLINISQSIRQEYKYVFFNQSPKVDTSEEEQSSKIDEPVETQDEIREDGIPHAVAKSLATIFGNESYLDTIPSLEREISEEIDIDAIDQPVTKGIDVYGIPKIIIKVRLTDKENAKKLLQALFEDLSADIEENINSVAEKTSQKEYFFYLSPPRVGGNPNEWNLLSIGKVKPKFFETENSIDITNEKGSLLEKIKGDQLTEFQKLFRGESAVDARGISWKLAD